MCALDGTRIDSSRRVAVVGARERPFSVKRICWLKGFAGIWGTTPGLTPPPFVRENPGVPGIPRTSK